MGLIMIALAQDVVCDILSSSASTVLLTSAVNCHDLINEMEKNQKHVLVAHNISLPDIAHSPYLRQNELFFFHWEKLPVTNSSGTRARRKYCTFILSVIL